MFRGAHSIQISTFSQVLIQMVLFFAMYVFCQQERLRRMQKKSGKSAANPNNTGKTSKDTIISN